MLLLGGSARAAADIPSSYVVLHLQYRGCQEKPISAVLIGDSKDSVTWYESTYINTEKFWFWFGEDYVSRTGITYRLVSDIPSTPSGVFVGAKIGGEIEITVVEHGQLRHAFTRSTLTDDILSKLVFDSRGEPDLRALVTKFKSDVDRYARNYGWCDPTRRLRAH
jgi:hypothetical protein